METPTDINDEIDQQISAEMTRFNTSPDIKNIMVTGGNGFLYVFKSSSYLALCHTLL